MEGTGAPISGELAQSVEDEAFTTISIELRSVSGESSAERIAFRESLLKARSRFETWHGSPYRIHHQKELLRMVYDQGDRDRLLREGLGGPPPPPPIDLEIFDKKKAMEGLFLSESQFDEMSMALGEKKNVVFQGAPGVGKTYVARRLAYALIGSNDPRRIEMIQFHQSYSYEDFIQGFRPTPHALNEVIAADTKNLGPGYQIGHSYFCLRNGTKPDDGWYRRVVESEIVPLIQEYWFDDDHKVSEQRSALLA